MESWEQLWPAAAFALAQALAVAGLVQVAGCLKPAAGAPLAGPAGRLAVGLLLLAVAALLAAALWLAITRLSWPVAIIAGGLGLLAGPLLWQQLARHDRLERPAALAILALVSAGTAAALATTL